MCGRPAFTVSGKLGQTARGPGQPASSAAITCRVRPLSTPNNHPKTWRVRTRETAVVARVMNSVQYLRSDKVLLENVLSSLSLCVSIASSLSWEVFHELFIFLSMLLDARMAENAGYGPPTEERTLRALQALGGLLRSITEASLTQLFLNLSAVGHCVSVAVTSLQSWESREVERASLAVLLSLTRLNEDDITTFTSERESTILIM